MIKDLLKTKLALELLGVFRRLTSLENKQTWLSGFIRTINGQKPDDKGNVTVTVGGEETDPIFTASPAADITDQDKTNWDEAHSWGDHATEGYLKNETDPVFTAWNVPDAAYLTPGTAASTYEPLLPDTPTNPETKYLNGNKEWARIRHNQLQAWNEDTNYQHINASDRTNLDNLSGTNSGDQLTYKTIAVAGQSDVVATSVTDTLTLAAGSNITLTTDAANRKVTITSAGGAGIGVATLNGLYGDLSIAGTTNQVSATASGSSITLSTPQNIHTAATPQFARLGLGVAAGASNVITAPGFTLSNIGAVAISYTQAFSTSALSITPTWNGAVVPFYGITVNPTVTAAYPTAMIARFGADSVYFLTLNKTGVFTHTSPSTSTASSFSTNQTWNGGTTQFSSILSNVTDVSSQASSMHLNCKTGGVTKFKVQKDGVPYATSYQLIGGTITAMSYNGTPVIGGNATWNGGGTSTMYGIYLNLTGTSYHSNNSKLVKLVLDGTTFVNIQPNGQTTFHADAIATGVHHEFNGEINYVASTATTFLINATDTASGAGASYFKVQQSGVDAFRVAKNSNIVIGSGALATTATNGFLNITTSPGAPTGVPTAYTGRVALHYDTTNNDLYIYNGGWKKTHLA